MIKNCEDHDTATADLFSRHNEVEYEPSVLKVIQTIRYCSCCLMEDGVHKSNCEDLLKDDILETTA